MYATNMAPVQLACNMAPVSARLSPRQYRPSTHLIGPQPHLTHGVVTGVGVMLPQAVCGDTSTFTGHVQVQKFKLAWVSA
jgi:hypothetical protein